MRTMKAVDYNSWLSVIKYVGDNIVSLSEQYGITITSSRVKPSFPRDLSKFEKPSIIVQKVSNSQSSMCFGKFIGQYYDEDLSAYIDINANQHLDTYQIDVFAESNAQCSLLKSIISEEMFGTISSLTLYDFTSNINNPPAMGICTILNDIESVSFGADEGSTYREAIRVDTHTVQTIVPSCEFVDLSKFVKVVQHILQ